MTATVAKQDFSIKRLRTLLSTDANVEWRHDVDFDPECALKMAWLERELGVQSTYYVMARSEFYNPFAALTCKVFLQIHDCGHQLGLHVDLGLPRKAKVSTNRMVQACLDDRDLLRLVLPVSNAVAFHAPPRDIMGRDIPGFEHAMGSEWVGKYIGDSRGVWKESPEKRLADGGPLQVNLHPEWWMWPVDVAASIRERELAAP